MAHGFGKQISTEIDRSPFQFSCSAQKFDDSLAYEQGPISLRDFDFLLLRMLFSLSYLWNIRRASHGPRRESSRIVCGKYCSHDLEAMDGGGVFANPVVTEVLLLFSSLAAVGGKAVLSRTHPQHYWPSALLIVGLCGRSEEHTLNSSHSQQSRMPSSA